MALGHLLGTDENFEPNLGSPRRINDQMGFLGILHCHDINSSLVPCIKHLVLSST